MTKYQAGKSVFAQAVVLLVLLLAVYLPGQTITAVSSEQPSESVTEPSVSDPGVTESGSPVMEPTPLPTEPGAAVDLQPLALAAGQLHSLLVHADGRLFAYGDNTYGQLGIGNEEPREGMLESLMQGNAVFAAAGAFHSVVLTKDGRVHTFGRNAFGQLGTGDVVNYSLPQVIEGIPPAATVAAGAYHTLILGQEGSVWAFGDNTSGQCGLASGENVQNEAGELIARRVIRPQRILAAGAKSIAAGSTHSLILLASGEVLAFGGNERGQLGDSSTESRTEMLPVPGISRATLIAAGSDHSLVVAGAEADSAGPDSDSVRADTTPAISAQSKQVLYAFGDNALGQLGTGSDYSQAAFSTSPIEVNWRETAGVDYEIKALVAGYGNSLLIVNKVSSSAAEVAPKTGSSSTDSPAAGNGQTDPRTARVLIWGSNAYGQLGSGNTTSADRPYLLQTADQGHRGNTYLPFDSAAIGSGHILLASSRGLYGAVGRNSNGQLGSNDDPNETTFVGVELPELVAEAPYPTLVEVRTAQLGKTVFDGRDQTKILPLQVPWDTVYAFGSESALEPADPNLSYIIIAAGLILLLATAAVVGWRLLKRHKSSREIN